MHVVWQRSWVVFGWIALWLMMWVVVIRGMPPFSLHVPVKVGVALVLLVQSYEYLIQLECWLLGLFFQGRLADATPYCTHGMPLCTHTPTVYHKRERILHTA